MNKILKKDLSLGGKIVAHCCIAFILLFPFLMTVSQAFMSIEESISFPVSLFPSTLTLESFKTALDGQVLNGLQNSLKVIIFNIFAVTLSGYIVSYAFAKLKFFGSNFCFALGMSTMLLPSIVLMVPRYVLYVDLGWINTLYPFTIPNSFGGGMANIFLMTQFLRGIPNTYCDAGKVDGASEWQIAFRIVMPLTKPVLMLFVFNTFLGSWNDFTGPLAYISREHADKWTLAVTIFDKFQYQAVTAKEKAPSLKAAMAIIMMLPSVVLFGFFQKSLIEGVTFTGIKG